MEKGKKKKRSRGKDAVRYEISTIPHLVRETGRVFVGCDTYNQRFEVEICNHRGCIRAKATAGSQFCPQYHRALKMKAIWEKRNRPVKSVRRTRKRKHKQAVEQTDTSRRRKRRRGK